ncbi:hypothetical protein [Paenibacillus lemnae]|uniref:Uncharacterized protein n=1 Tax=Paenibacillus lemnae TaxID=1330551 RepID=A0A848M9V0_PAELE|nr:hypothetical protein [Paenibacillus lemnae]NMO97455.1 hypothetical protein [Paenibacillus lemnae]
MFENKDCSLGSNSGYWNTLNGLKEQRKLDPLVFGEVAYEAGMKFVVKEMARSRHMSDPEIKDFEWRGDDITQAREKTKTLMQQLKEVLSEEHYRLVLELDDALSLEMNYSQELQYANGFWDGYRYVRLLE